MIGSFENTPYKVAYPGQSKTNLARVRTLFITDQDYTFSSVSEFEDRDNWISDIKAENIFYLKDIKQVEDDSEQNEYNKSEFDYEYSTKPGKYRYNLATVYNVEHHNFIEGFSGQNLRVFLADVNNNIAGNLSGASVRGMDVELFHVEKKKLAASGVMWTTIRLVLSDPTEFNHASLMTWNPNKINLIHVDVTSVSGSGSEVEFTVKDSNFDIPIDNLFISDVSLTDNAGGITALSLEQTGCGEYKITASGALTVGTININSDRFYGSAQYIILQDTVIFNNYTYTDDNNFEVDIRLSGDLSLYAGLVLADFTMTDDTNGAVSISSVNEVSTGRYAFVTTTNLTTGTISVDDGSVTGSDSYSVVIAVEGENVGAPSYSTFVLPAVFEFDLVEVETGNPVTGLDPDNFTVVDSTYGTATLDTSNTSEVSPGTYRITSSDILLNNVTVTINEGIYQGTVTYTNPGIAFTDLGGSDTTDFTSVTSGFSDNMSRVHSSSYTASIVSGESGFTGNVQRLEKTATNSLVGGMIASADYMQEGVQYKIRFRYRLTNNGSGSDRYLKVLIQSGFDLNLTYDIVSSGFSSLFESDPFYVTPDSRQIVLSMLFSKYGMSVLVDEIELIEV